MSLSDIRREFLGEPLSEQDANPDPFQQFARWFEQVREVEPDPTTMMLATATRAGRPSLRAVLLKGVDARGFVFYTNYRSRKAGELEETHRAALLFYWASLERQVRIEGVVERVSADESDAYFASRPLDSRWSVYASRQSAVVDSRETLEAGLDAAREQYGTSVPRPEWWGGYLVRPDAFEFWQGRRSRLHDRVRYLPADGTDQGWRIERLAP